ncbi:hypothetical protein K8O93_00795 [Gordonia bronchialis]|uniref:hypothetical protein n=1 Tax=Gordonia bronchialis TaxID=2054 RepID=UPI001CBF6E10|nr:hypothetical protein [Gordonia bronchialis]UAK38371.1 hypothetical protein K8O93_00795 [Gordonia bronchialis]
MSEEREILDWVGDLPMTESHRSWLYGELIDHADSLDDRVTYADVLAAFVSMSTEVIQAARVAARERMSDE